MSDIFISYSRKDIAVARLVHNALKENGFETWVDWQDIPPSIDWMREVYTAIEETDTFIFILSQSSNLSEVCKLEIEHAKKNNKRLIPILIDDLNASSVHPVLAALNWIFWRTQDELQPAIENLIKAIQTDYDWVKTHTRLQVRALEWNRANQDKSYLLQGTDLQQAENWLTSATEKSPEPTLLHTRYIQASRQNAARKQRRLLFAVGVAFVITIVLGMVAFINGQHATSNALSLSTQIVVAQDAVATAQQEAYFRATQQSIAVEQQSIAVEQKTFAEARELAALSLNLIDSNLPLAQLLAVEGYKKDANSLTRGSLLSSLQYSPSMLRSFNQPFIVVTMIFLPNGELFATSGGRSIHFWNPITGLEDGEPLIGHLDAVREIAINLDGTILASVSQDGSLKLWDIKNRTLIRDLLVNPKNNYPNEVAFSSDGHFVACSTRQGEFWMWDLDTFQVLTPDSGPVVLGSLENILFTPNNKTLITNGNYGIELWDVDTLEKTGEFLLDGKTADDIYRVTLSPNGKLLAGTDSYGNLYLWDLATSVLISKTRSLESEDFNFTSDIIYHPSGSYLYTIDSEAIKFWNGTNGQYLGIFKDYNQIRKFSVFDRLLISPDGRFLLWGNGEGTIKMWETFEHVNARDPFFDYTGIGAGLAYSADGKILAYTGMINSDDYVIQIWDAETMSHLKTIPLGKKGDLDSVTNWYDDFLIFQPDGTLIYAGISDEIRFFDGKEFENLGSPIYSGEKVENIALSPDGSILAVVHGLFSTQGVQLWDMETRQVIKILTLDPELYSDDYFFSLTFSPDGKILVCGLNAGLITFWNIESGQQIGDPIVTTGSMVNHLIFNKDGSRFFSAIDNEIRMWDIQTRFSIGAPMTGHLSEITQLLLDYDETTLISSDADGTIRLWDINLQQPIGLPIQANNARQLSAAIPGYDPILNLAGHESRIQNMVLSFEGTLITAKDADGIVRVWDLDINTWLEKACLRAGRNLTPDEWALYFPEEQYRATCPQYSNRLSLAVNSEVEMPTNVTSRIRELDGAIEVFVPSGEFEMGNVDWEITAVQLHHVFLDAYWIDQTEITNAQYSACVSANACSLPAINSSNTRSSGYYGIETYNQYPVINVTWSQAMEYCKWVGGHLPTEAEWERAAKGNDNRIYPWGNTAPDSSSLNFSDLVGDTTAVGSYPVGISPFGALDMAGNVAEWVYDYFGENYYSQSPYENPKGPDTGDYYSYRGGSWYDVKFVYTWIRSYAFIGYFSDRIGFRCSTD